MKQRITVASLLTVTEEEAVKSQTNRPQRVIASKGLKEKKLPAERNRWYGGERTCRKLNRRGEKNSRGKEAVLQGASFSPRFYRLIHGCWI